MKQPFLLGVNPEYLNKKYNNFLRISFSQLWKKDAILMISNWDFKLEECVAKEKLTVNIHSRSLTKFKPEWFPYIQYFMQFVEYKYLPYGF